MVMSNYMSSGELFLAVVWCRTKIRLQTLPLSPSVCRWRKHLQSFHKRSYLLSLFHGETSLFKSGLSIKVAQRISLQSKAKDEGRDLKEKGRKKDRGERKRCRRRKRNEWIEKLEARLEPCGTRCKTLSIIFGAGLNKEAGRTSWLWTPGWFNMELESESADQWPHKGKGGLAIPPRLLYTALKFSKTRHKSTASVRLVLGRQLKPAHGFPIVAAGQLLTKLLCSLI